MGDVDAVVAKEEDAASDAGSEDLEAESSGSEDEEEEELAEGENGEADEDMEMGEPSSQAPTHPPGTELMAH
jgi:histone chaperone ASF1